MAQREEGPHSRRSLSRGYETPGHQINGGDVICVEGMAQAQDVGECGGRNELWMEMKNYSNGRPDEDVDEDEKCDDSDAVCGYAANESWFRKGRVEDSGEATHDGW